MYQNMDERINEVSQPSAIAAKEKLIGLTPQQNLHRHIAENQQYFKTMPERQLQATTVSGRLNVPDEPIQFYHADEIRNPDCDSIDLTKDYETNILDQRTKLNSLRYHRNGRASIVHSELNRNKIQNDADPLLQQVRRLQADCEEEHEIAKSSQRNCDDFDFSIPFNESKILVKVMTPDGKMPINVIAEPDTLLHETLEHGAEPISELNAAKRVSFDEEARASKLIELLRLCRYVLPTMLTLLIPFFIIETN